MQSRSSVCLANLDTFRSVGLTRVINYSQLDTTATELSTYLSHAAANGMKIVVSIKDLYDTADIKSTYAALSATCPSPCTTAPEFAAYVAGIAKSNAGTWGYYIGDETPVSAADEAATAAIYRAVKAVDPDHPILFVGTEGINTDLADLTSEIQPFAPYADVLGVDHYSIGAGDLTGASQLPISQSLHSLASSYGKASALVLQAFGWTEYGMDYCSPYPSCAAFPTKEQMESVAAYAVRGDPDVSMMLWYSYFEIQSSSSPATNLANLTAALKAQ